MRKVIFTHYDNWHKTLYLTNNLVFSKNIKDAAICLCRVLFNRLVNKSHREIVIRQKIKPRQTNLTG